MSALIKGNGIIWSVGGITFTAGIVSATNAAFQQSQRMSRSSEKSEIKGTDGEIKAQVFHGFRKQLSIQVAPNHATTLTGARASAEAWMPKPGTKITVADSGGEFAIAADNYNCLSADQARTVDAVGLIDLVLEAGDESTELATDPIV